MKKKEIKAAIKAVKNWPLEANSCSLFSCSCCEDDDIEYLQDKDKFKYG